MGYQLRCSGMIEIFKFTFFLMTFDIKLNVDFEVLSISSCLTFSTLLFRVVQEAMDILKTSKTLNI